MAHKKGFYEKYIKRPQDFVLASAALVVLSPVMAVTAALVRAKLGSPVIFTQERPGMIDPKTGKEKIFKLYKFRTMTDERDENGELLPDDVRLTKFGKTLRSTSLDELPELINIIKGDMAVVGPRPLLVRDMVFMTSEQRKRHLVRPGLTGLAQVNGRNSISWQKKLSLDIVYLERIGFLKDISIIFKTFKKVVCFSNKKDRNSEIEITLDYGDALLQEGAISESQYNMLQEKARGYLEDYIRKAKNEAHSVIF